MDYLKVIISGGCRIFLRGVPTPKMGVLIYYFDNRFAENCIKMKEFGPGGGVVCPWYPPLDVPMITPLASSNK